MWTGGRGNLGPKPVFARSSPPRGVGSVLFRPPQLVQKPTGDWGCLGCGWAPHAEREGEGPPPWGEGGFSWVLIRDCVSVSFRLLLIAPSLLFQVFRVISRIASFCGLSRTFPTARLMRARVIAAAKVGCRMGRPSSSSWRLIFPSSSAVVAMRPGPMF